MNAYRLEIADAARARGLDPQLVEAFVQVESGGEAYAWNPEPRYPYFYDVRTRAPFREVSADEVRSKLAPADFTALAGDRDQEWWAQQASWGLMQVMGAVAREHGYREPYLTRLTRVEDNLAVGCKHLQGLLLWADGDIAKAAGAYNAGRGGWKSADGQAYAAKILAAWRRAQGR